MARILGLDPGTKRCGVAVSDSAETMAFPRPALAVDEELVRRIGDLANEESVELVVVGRPVALSGRETSSTSLADDVFARLSGSLELPVVQHDERLTTTSAQRSLSHAGVSARDQRARVDSAAAVVLLESYLETRRHG